MIYCVALSNIKLVHCDLIVSSFEFMEVLINLHHKSIRSAIIYRPGHPGTERSFMDEFGLFLESFS